jgi:hypothetical protein
MYKCRWGFRLRHISSPANGAQTGCCPIWPQWSGELYPILSIFNGFLIFRALFILTRSGARRARPRHTVLACRLCPFRDGPWSGAAPAPRHPEVASQTLRVVHISLGLIVMYLIPDGQFPECTYASHFAGALACHLRFPIISIFTHNLSVRPLYL